jgi:hypothetical protein
MGVWYAYWIYHDAWFWAKITARSQMVSRTACGLWYFTSVGKAFHCSIPFYRHDNYCCIFNFYLFQMGQINFNGFLAQMAWIWTAQRSSLVVYCWVNRHRWWKLAKRTDSWRVSGECLLSKVKCYIQNCCKLYMPQIQNCTQNKKNAGNYEWLISTELFIYIGTKYDSSKLVKKIIMCKKKTAILCASTELFLKLISKLIFIF